MAPLPQVGQAPFAAPLGVAGQSPFTEPLRVAGQPPFTAPLRAASQPPFTESLRVPGQSPFTVPLRVAGQSPFTAPLPMPADDTFRPGGALTLFEVAELPRALYQSIVFGDTDHDSRNEAILYDGSNSVFQFHLFEEQGDNVYTEEYAGPSLIPYAVADLDGDGKSEVIGQDGYHIYVYESPDGASHPSQLAWTSPPLENIVGLTAVGDTDGDGKMEILHSLNTWESGTSLLIYENDGDDAYTLVYEAATGTGDKGEKLIADIDQDGRVEIVFSGSNGDFHVFESNADNSWTETFSVQTDLFNANSCKGGVDTDGNGKPEVFLQGSRSVGWTTYIFEASGDNEYEVVATLVEDDGYVGLSSNALARLVAGGPIYYVSDIAERLSIYEPVAPGNWQKQLEVPDPNGTWHNGIFAFDVNGNGRDELFWGTNGAFPSLVLESPTDPSSLEEDDGWVGGTGGTGGTWMSARARSTLRVSPNPIGGAPGHIASDVSLPESLVHPGACLDVLDAAGRIVRAQTLERFPGEWSAEGLPSGRYYLRLQDAVGLRMSGSVIVIR